jgi:hypothetical protein
MLFDRRDPKSALQKTVARAHRRPKWAPHYGAQVDLGLAQDTQAMLRLCSGLLRLAQALLRHAYPRLRYAYPQLRLKQQLLTFAD